MARVELALITICGFGQEYWDRNVGLVRHWQWMRNLSSAAVFVANPWAWNEQWRKRAQFINLLEPMRTMVFSYSWGAGWGLTQLERHLDAPVDHAVMIDPVYRSPWFPSWLPLNPLSLTKLFSIRLKRVRSVDLFRQRVSRPYGCKVKGPAIKHDLELSVGHILADDAPAVHDVMRQRVLEFA